MLQKIIGIDPGTLVLGYAIISIDNKKMTIESIGVIQLHQYEDHYEKLKKIYEKITYLITTYQPDELAIEAPFHGKNVQSMLKLGRAQGVAIAAAMMQNIPVSEYAPRTIKQAITGKGSATKEQIAAMLQYMLKIDTLPQFLDATDALSVAVCHYLRHNTVVSTPNKAKKTNKSNSWKNFVTNNPDKVKQ